jgi:hypothetical protein
MTLLEIQYFLQLWDIVCAYHLDVSANLVDHHGELLVQNGTLVNLQRGFPHRLVVTKPPTGRHRRRQRNGAGQLPCFHFGSASFGPRQQ